MSSILALSNILDPIHATLDPSVWDSPDSPQPKLKDQHAHWIKHNVYEVLEDSGYDKPHEWLKLVLTGSLTTYQYSAESDCDVSLFVDTKVFPDWSRAEMIGLMVDHTDGLYLPKTTHPMQYFVVGREIKPHDIYKPGLRSGYDIDLLKWIVPPEFDRSHDVKAEENGFYIWAQSMADKMERLLRYEPDKATQFWHQIHKKRQRDQASGKGDYAQSNIIYKYLANRGLFPKISEQSGEYIASTKTAAPDDKWMEDEAFKYIAQNPGARIPQIADHLGVMQHHMYRLLPKMEKSTDLVRPSEDPRGWYTLEGAWGKAYPSVQSYPKPTKPIEIHGEGWSEPRRIELEGLPWGDEMEPKYGSTSFAQKVFDATLKNEGITISLSGIEPSTGYVFSPQIDTQEMIPLHSFTPDHVDTYIMAHRPQLEGHDMYLGTWLAGGDVYLDVVENHNDREEAFKRAWDGHQKEMWDVENKTTIPVRGMDYEQPLQPTAV